MIFWKITIQTDLLFNKEHFKQIHKTDNRKRQKHVFSLKRISKENGLSVNFLLSLITPAEKSNPETSHSGLCTLPFLVLTLSTVALHFQTSLEKLTPVINSFSPLPYSTCCTQEAQWGSECYMVILAEAVSHIHFQLVCFLQSLISMFPY